jgi:predicted signal transduction protein with EAL and GGDEF domain
MLARLGGDEFTLVLEHVPNQNVAGARAASIIEKICQPYNLEGHTVSVDASIGIALDSESVADIEDLLKMADLALYKCKDESGNQFCHYDPSMLVRMEERRSLESGLRQAVKKDEFELYYQPLFDLKSLKMVGAEALIRWRHPLDGLILPGQFLPLAEEMRLLDRIGAWVLERACRDAALWPDDLRVAVNLSPNQVVHTDIVATVRDMLSVANLPGNRLELEVTESVILGNNSRTQQKLVDLKSLGVGLTMDDFGTGYSSLAYLSRFPFDRIKIDRSFVDGMINNNNCASIVRATVDLARNLKMLTTAEGIETWPQLDKLADLGVDLGQGYLFSKPLTAEDFAVFMLKTSIEESSSFTDERGFFRQTA